MNSRKITDWIIESALCACGSNIALLAERSGFSSDEIKSWLRGSVSPTTAQLEQLVDLMERDRRPKSE